MFNLFLLEIYNLFVWNCVFVRVFTVLVRWRTKSSSALLNGTVLKIPKHSHMNFPGKNCNAICFVFRNPNFFSFLGKVWWKLFWSNCENAFYAAFLLDLLNIFYSYSSWLYSWFYLKKKKKRKEKRKDHVTRWVIFEAHHSWQCPFGNILMQWEDL